jgi:hypothetical protein
MHKLFKILTATAIALSLIACSGADTPVETVPVIEAPPTVVVQPPVLTPAPFPPILFCPQSKNVSGGCSPSPYPIRKPLPVLNVACDENPLHGCPPNPSTPAPVTKPDPVTVVAPPVDEWDCIVGCDTSTGM